MQCIVSRGSIKIVRLDQKSQVIIADTLIAVEVYKPGQTQLRYAEAT